MIDIYADLQKIKETYETASQNFSALFSGDLGTGKTTLLTTAQRPIYIYEFDPDGARSIRDEIDWKTVFVDSRFDHDDPKLPTAYQKWGLDFLTKKNTGFFNNFGTVALDSLTTFSDIIMYDVLKKAGRIGQVPRAAFGKAGDNDYVLQMNELLLRIREFMSLPCNFFVTCHLETEQDGVTKQIKTYPLIPGKLKTRIPLLFTDIFVCTTKRVPVTTDNPKGVIHELLTRNDGNYIARTKTGRHQIFETYEKQDIKYLLKKAKLPFEDKPPIDINKEKEEK